MVVRAARSTAAIISRTSRRDFLLNAMVAAVIVSASAEQVHSAENDPLPSWNEGAVRQSILDFVAAVTTVGSPDYMKPENRIATFDNDGTLWVEQPMYTQLAFALDRVKALAPEHPEWKEKQPFKAVLDGDMKTLAESGERGMLELVMATHADMTTEEFENHRRSLARRCPSSQVQAAVYRARLSAHAGSACLPAYERVQDLHRVGWRRRVHATVDRTGLRCAARTGRGIEHQDEV